MPNWHMITDIINPLHFLNKLDRLKLNKSNELAHLILVLAFIAVSRNEGLGEPV